MTATRAKYKNTGVKSSAVIWHTKAYQHGLRDGLAGTRNRAWRWPQGEDGNADYDLGLSFAQLFPGTARRRLL